MGLVPVHVFDDVPWASFKERLQNVGCVLNISESESIVINVSIVSIAEL